MVSWLSEDHDLEMEKSPLSPMGKGRPHPFSAFLSQAGTCLRKSQSSPPSFFRLPAWAGMGSSYSDRWCSPAHHLHPSGSLRPPSSSQLLPDPRRRREEGEPRPPWAAPPLSTESTSEEEGSEPDSRGSCRLRLGAGEREAGAAPRLLTQSPR